MQGWFCADIGVAAGGGLGGFPPGGGRGFEVDIGGEGAAGGVAPLGFLVGGGCATDLAVEDIEEVCVGLKELLDVWVLGGGSTGAGCFPLDTGGVGT